MKHAQNSIEAANEARRLALSEALGNPRFGPSEKLPANIRRLLAMHDYDPNNRFLLADGGPTAISNLTSAAGFAREVYEASLCDFRVMNLVRVLTTPTAKIATGVPYEVIKKGNIANDGIVYEGREIQRTSIEQRMDTAYVNKMALALLISNEFLLFSENNLLKWDGFARAVDSNSRVVRELLGKRIINEHQRAADAFGAVEQTESIATQLDGSHSLLKVANWPIVRPKQERDLQGSAIGDPECPISVVLNNAPVAEFDGSGDQTAGIYWRVENFNLGFLRFVDQTGEAVTPTATTASSITYWQSTNCSKFDLKLPGGVAVEDHLNGLLRAIGARKAVMSTDRFILPDFALMSPVLNDILSNARQFVVSESKPGTGLSLEGDLLTVKAIPCFATNATCDFRDDRILIGATDTLSYVVVKPLSTNGSVIELFDPVSRTPNGLKAVYVEEYSVIHIPKPLRNRLTSVIVYDSDARSAAT